MCAVLLAKHCFCSPTSCIIPSTSEHEGNTKPKNKTLCLACGLWDYSGKWILMHPDRRVHSKVQSADRTANNSGSRTPAGVRAFLGLGVTLSKLEVSFAVWFLERTFLEGCRGVQVHIQASPSGLASASLPAIRQTSIWLDFTSSLLLNMQRREKLLFYLLALVLS